MEGAERLKIVDSIIEVLESGFEKLDAEELALQVEIQQRRNALTEKLRLYYKERGILTSENPRS